MRLQKLIRIALCLAFVLPVLMVGFAAAQDDEEVTLITYGGHVIGSENEFVAIGVGGDSVTIYICDGDPEEGTVSIAEWFLGEINEDGTIDITSNAGHRVEATVAETTAEGHFTFADGTTKEFELELLEGESGLFRSEFAFGEVAFVGGWLVLPDGSVRGAVRNLDTNELTPATLLDFNQLVAEDSE